MEADVPMEDWEQIGILSGHRGLVLALAVYKDRLISGSGGSWKVPSCRCHSPPAAATAHHCGLLGRALQVFFWRRPLRAQWEAAARP